MIARSVAEQPVSKLSTLLLDLWSWGELSTPMLQKIAAAAEDDGLDIKDIKKLASLGSRGLYPGNMHVELTNHLRPSNLVQQCSSMVVFYKNTNVLKGGIVSGRVPILLPHELFAIMWREYRESFCECLFGNQPDRIAKFWTAMEKSAYFKQHPMSTRLDLKERGIPLSLHGDGVSIVGINKTWTKSVDAYSWSSIIGQGSLKSTNFLIFVEYWKLLVQTAGMDTHMRLMKLLQWSFYWLSIGKWPTRDEHGVQYPPDSVEARRASEDPFLAGGYYGVLYLVKGDLEHMHKAFDFKAAGGADRCSCCQANTSDVPWTDCRAGAAWEATIWSDEDWRHDNPNRNPIFQLPGIGISAFLPDVMHCVYLGSYQYCFGSVIQFLAYHKMARSPEANCVQLWSDLKAEYHSLKTKHQLSDLKVSKFYKGPGAFPILKGRAAELRHLPHPLLKVFMKYMGDNDIDRRIVLILQMACQMEDIITDHMHLYVWPSNIVDIYQKAVRVFVQCNQSLAHDFHGDGLYLFHMTIKYHYMIHIALRARDINPTLGWCFSGESMMKKVKDICSNSHRGSPPLVASVKSMQKYAFGLGLQLHKGMWS